jgi:hypothetical protein
VSRVAVVLWFVALLVAAVFGGLWLGTHVLLQN